MSRGRTALVFRQAHHEGLATISTNLILGPSRDEVRAHKTGGNT